MNRSVRVDPLILGLLALSLAGNVWLGRQVRRLRAFEPPAPKLSVGARWPPLSVLDAEGQPASVQAEGQSRPTVFYVFSPTCSWCQRNTDAVAALARAASTTHRFVGLCVGEHKACAEASDRPPFPTYSQLPGPSLDDLGLNSVPQTIVVTREAKVAGVFHGAYVGSLRGEIESFFGVALPALAASEPPRHSP